MSSQHVTPRQHFVSQDDARALNMLLRLGTVYEVDYDSIPPKARIESGDLITDFLPLPEEIGHNFRRWRPCRVGTQVLVACPSGDSRQGVIVALYNTQTIPQPETDPEVDLILFEDGTEIRKDGKQLLVDSTVPVSVKAPDINATAENEINLKAQTINVEAGAINLIGQTTVSNGDLVKEGGSVTHDGTLIDKTHVHLITVPMAGAPVTPPMSP